jgi:hypothetical protein
VTVDRPPYAQAVRVNGDDIQHHEDTNGFHQLIDRHVNAVGLRTALDLKSLV